MKSAHIKTTIKHLKAIVKANIPVEKYEELFNVKAGTIRERIKQINAEIDTIDPTLVKDFNECIKNLASNKNPQQGELFNRLIADADVEVNDGFNNTELVRDENGKISAYRFTVKIRDRKPLTGELSRNEMETIYKLYSRYGSNITQRDISREFSTYSLEDFKRILRAFSITKASSPFAPHFIEETPKEKLLEIYYREYENNFLIKVEKEKVRENEKLVKKLIAENSDLKQQLNSGSKLLEGLNLSNVTPLKRLSCKTSDTLIIWLSDMHIGASVSSQSIYCNKYDKEVVEERLNSIIEHILETNPNCYFENIIVVNLGDSLDGYNAQTTRGGHNLPQNMNNKEQLHTFINVMNNFFINLSELVTANNYKYYCVGESNHDGDFGYAANIALGEILKTRDVECTIFENFIGQFKVYDTNFVVCHGKDNKDMFKNLPLVLNEKTENFINEYLDYNDIFGKVVFVKGDLHQSATTHGRRFTYKSVASLFGSSEWIHKNFGNTKWGCDYSIITNNNIINHGLVNY